MRQLLPCVMTEGEEEREKEREVRMGHLEETIDWRLYTSLFLRDDEGKKYKREWCRVPTTTNFVIGKSPDLYSSCHFLKLLYS